MLGMRDLSDMPPICYYVPPIWFLLRAMPRLVGSTRNMVAAMGRAMREPYKEDLGEQQEEVEEEVE